MKEGQPKRAAGGSDRKWGKGGTVAGGHVDETVSRRSVVGVGVCEKPAGNG